ncbi:DUF502 domain-containing protein [Oceanomicrobium pacificus]|uniref:DUF502 domain-containing protein n=1 Tax=Oceanomicrobium pacificus TaxID=2692916 RepID=A0A6B0TX28_9RHOB|nr:DUF502 domain-containing protein [Oceanomicrobium pacificus]MXU65842.1 DUF502 domain-containing protein [Oceanomicrobium pacificus]
MAKKPKKKKILLPQPKQTIVQRVRSNFLTGLVVVAPVSLTIYIIWTVVAFIDAKVVPLVPDVYNPATYLGQDIAGFGVVIFIVFTAIVGALTKGLFGRQLIRFGESIVDRMPIVRSVYNGLKQIVETVLSQNQATFEQACLIEYPRKDVWVVAFISTESRGEIPRRAGEDELLSIFVPTTPNPTSGFLLFLPKRDVIVLDMKVEDAAKLVISAGLVVPPTAEEIAAGRAGSVRRPPARVATTAQGKPKAAVD